MFSILIKSAISQTTWEELYKKFVHPAGFYIAGSVVTDVEAVGNITAPLATADSGARGVISSVVETISAPFTQLTSLTDSGVTTFRSRLDEKINEYQALTSQELEKFYSNIDEITTVKSFTFDDSDNRASVAAATPDFSLDLETMDNEQFDSSFNS